MSCVCLHRLPTERVGGAPSFFAVGRRTVIAMNPIPTTSGLFRRA
ncbi:hypothetical protein [Polaromonas sp.]